MNHTEKEASLEERARAKKIFAHPITQGANHRLAAVLYGAGLSEEKIIEACAVAVQATEVIDFEAGASSARRLLGKATAAMPRAYREGAESARRLLGK